ncbi:hypothetical protein NIASO_16535 [Niabella soli DSM 19437]|uniref:Uncharacterized protein n=1 Tax=Niabella soli DSM 19437 TaxID=929713 RepID=W0F4H2_9BACT|nr:hypothetical protein NIASO_16535 [Niabella soli DSM 19437]
MKLTLWLGQWQSKKHLKFLYYEGLLHLNRCIV